MVAGAGNDGAKDKRRYPSLSNIRFCPGASFCDDIIVVGADDSEMEEEGALLSLYDLRINCPSTGFCGDVMVVGADDDKMEDIGAFFSLSNFCFCPDTGFHGDVVVGAGDEVEDKGRCPLLSDFSFGSTGTTLALGLSEKRCVWTSLAGFGMLSEEAVAGVLLAPPTKFITATEGDTVFFFSLGKVNWPVGVFTGVILGSLLNANFN